MKNFVQVGNDLTIPAAADTESGDLVIAGALIGVAAHDAASGDLVTNATTGVFDLPKVGSQAWTVGVAVYWDAANSRCTTASSGNTLIGAATEAVSNAAGNLIGRVKINV